MSANIKYIDLVSFGNDMSKEGVSLQLQNQFIVEIKERFPDVMLEDVSNESKGYRKKVGLKEEEKDDYLSWLIAFQYYNISNLMFIMNTFSIIDQSLDSEMDIILKKAIEQYPEKFKTTTK